MPRTGQPAVRHVAAVERAVAVLDVLSDGSAELGTNEIARRTGQREGVELELQRGPRRRAPVEIHRLDGLQRQLRRQRDFFSVFFVFALGLFAAGQAGGEYGDAEGKN